LPSYKDQNTLDILSSHIQISNTTCDFIFEQDWLIEVSPLSPEDIGEYNIVLIVTDSDSE